jgi:hypothetical protein
MEQICNGQPCYRGLCEKKPGFMATWAKVESFVPALYSPASAPQRGKGCILITAFAAPPALVGQGWGNNECS